MTTYTGHRVEDHEDFILEQLLPLIVDHAGASDTPHGGSHLRRAPDPGDHPASQGAGP
ncbi:hypothetical protein ACFS3C_20745 [Azotobacter vinelandii]